MAHARVCVCLSAGYFTFWIILAMIWGILATFVCIVLPLWEAKDDIWMIIW